MSFRKHEQGMTLVELLTVIVLIGIISPLVMWFFGSSIASFLKLQEANGLASNGSRALSRMQQVIRSGTQITAASANSLTIYAYFSPADATLSQVTYSYTASTATIKAEKIPATGSAPNYTYNPSDKVTYTIMSGITLKKDLFSYEDSAGGNGPFDSATFQNIKVINIDIFGVSSGVKATPLEVKAAVLLRNRKVGL